MRGFTTIIGLLFVQLALQSNALARQAHTPPQVQAGWSAKFLTYNIWGLNGIAGGQATWRYPEIAKQLRAYDVVSLQEVWSEKAADMLRGLEKDFLHVLRSDHMERTLWGSGMALLSRFPVIEYQTLFYKSCFGADCLIRKGALFARLKMPDGSLLDVYNTHLNSAQKIGNWNIGNNIRLSQMHQLRKWIEKRSVKENVDYVLLGDFNIPEESKTYTQMLEILNVIDLLRFHHPKRDDYPFFTYDDERNSWIEKSDDPLRVNQVRLDYFFLGNGPSDIQMQNGGLAMHESIKISDQSERHLSDHFAVAVELQSFGKER